MPADRSNTNDPDRSRPSPGSGRRRQTRKRPALKDFVFSRRLDLCSSRHLFDSLAAVGIRMGDRRSRLGDRWFERNPGIGRAEQLGQQFRRSNRALALA